MKNKKTKKTLGPNTNNKSAAKNLWNIVLTMPFKAKYYYEYLGQ